MNLNMSQTYETVLCMIEAEKKKENEKEKNNNDEKNLNIGIVGWMLIWSIFLCSVFTIVDVVAIFFPYHIVHTPIFACGICQGIGNLFYPHCLPLVSPTKNVSIGRVKKYIAYMNLFLLLW